MKILADERYPLEDQRVVIHNAINNDRIPYRFNAASLVIEDPFIHDHPVNLTYKRQYRNPNGVYVDISPYAPLEDSASFMNALVHGSRKLPDSDLILYAKDLSAKTPKSSFFLKKMLYKCIESIWRATPKTNYSNLERFLDEMQEFSTEGDLFSNIIFYLRSYISLANATVGIDPVIAKSSAHGLALSEPFRNIAESLITDCENRPNLFTASLLKGELQSLICSRVKAAQSFQIAQTLASNFIEYFHFDNGFMTYGTPQQQTRIPEINMVSDAIPISDTTFLLSTDVNFFRRYGGQILLYAEMLHDVHIHFHILGDPLATKSAISEANTLFDSMLSFQKSSKLSIPPTYSHEAVPHDVTDARTYYACSRYLVAPSLLDFFSRDLYIMDIDLFLQDRPDNYFMFARKFDVTIPFSAGLVNIWPWRRLMAGSVFIKNTPAGRNYANHVKQYIDSYITGSSNLWMLDQNALLWAYEKCQERVHFGNRNAGGVTFLTSNPTLAGIIEKA